MAVLPGQGYNDLVASFNETRCVAEMRQALSRCNWQIFQYFAMLQQA